MKTALQLLAIFISGALFADDLAFFDNVTNLWFQGNKSNVLSIAQERLSHDRNDLPGLILKMEYDMAFLNFDTLSNSVMDVMHQLPRITSTNFIGDSEIFTASLTHLLDIQTNSMLYECAVEDRKKAALPAKRMLYEDVLRWMCLDAPLTNYPSAPQ